MEITEAEFQALWSLRDFIDNPRRFGCAIDLGDDATYEQRIGGLFTRAEAALIAVGDRRGQPQRTIAPVTQTQQEI